MSPPIVGLAGIVLLFGLMFLRMPIGFVFYLVGFSGLALVASVDAGLGAMALTLYRVFTDYNLTVVPLFILMGEFAYISGISQEVFITAEKWLVRLPGGVALATIGGCTAFGAICGSSVATAATLGSVALPEMKRLKYDDRLATGVVAAGGTLGFLIPPSIGFVIYGILTEQSVGKLLVAGIFPGLLLAAVWMVTILVWIKLNPNLAPTSHVNVSWKDRIWSLQNTWTVILTFFLVIGGMYTGMFTPTEAASIGATALFLIALFKRKLTMSSLFASLKETSRVTIMLLVIFSGALIFGYFLALTTLPAMLLSFMMGLDVSRYVILAIIIIILLILGCIIDIGAMMVLTLPIFLPIMKALNFNLIWFGVICVLMMNAGLITPPVGLNVYVTASIAKDVPMYTIFRGIAPFLLGIILVTIIVTVFPQIALYLPNMMR